MAFQTILGASGGIGIPLAKALANYTTDIRLVSRNPKKVNETDVLHPADLTNFSTIDAAVAGSEVVYVTIGFEYSTKVWQAVWPPFIDAVIAACARHNAKLVFFDNVYMYDHNQLANMTEDTPMRPQSAKGKVRKQLVERIWRAVENGEIDALIARAADFLATNNSFYAQAVLANFKNGKPADWLISEKHQHNFTYVADAGRAVALLGNTPDAYNQTWHLPSTETKSGKQWIELAAKIAGVAPKYRVAAGWMVSLLGLWMPVMREMKEMTYQLGTDYYLNSDKFHSRFAFECTPTEVAVKELYDLL